MILKDLTGKEVEIKKCLGCEMASEEVETFGGILYRDKTFVISQDFELPIDGFIVIASIEHHEQLMEFTEEERTNLMFLINKTITLLKSYGISEEYNVILEEKQGYHFHVWIMPRHKWMVDKFGKVLKNIKNIQEYAIENMCTDENFEKISKTCKKLKLDLNKK